MPLRRLDSGCDRRREDMDMLVSVEVTDPDSRRFQKFDLGLDLQGDLPFQFLIPHLHQQFMRG